MDFAIANGLEHGGYCPAGRKAEDGIIPDRYNLTETPSGKYEDRTLQNVLSADATLIFNFKGSPGSNLTHKYCIERRKPYWIVRNNDQNSILLVKHWLERHDFQVLNVAGNRESVFPGIYACVVHFLGEVIKNEQT